MKPHDAALASQGEVLTLVRHYPVPREALYRAFTDPAELALWWGPEGMDAPIVELDVRAGGAWRTCMRNDEGELFCVGGEYLEVAPPERLVKTWAWEGGDWAGVVTTLTLEFLETDGGSELRLTHAGLADAEARGQHQGGWTSSLGCLERHLGERAST